MAGQVHGEPADNYGQGGDDAHGVEGQPSELGHAVGVHGEEDEVAGEGEGEAEGDEGGAGTGAVGEVGERHAEDDGGGPGYDGVELCGDGGVAVRGHDGGNEVCETWLG